MAKNKSFDFGSLIPQIEAQAPKAPNIVPEKKIEPKSISAELQSASVAAMPSEAPQDMAEPTSSQKANNQLSMQPKKRNDKRVNYIVNADDNDEFTRINKRLGYSNNEIIIALMDKYIKANRE